MTAMSGGLRGLVAVLLLAAQCVSAAVLPVPAPAGRVVDATGTLSVGERSALEAKLAELEARKGAQIVVLLVPTTRPEAIEQFSMRVVEAWKPGRKGIDDGVLLLVATEDREVRIEVGYGLEGAIPDAAANRIIDEFIVPSFRQGDFAGGIEAGVDRLIGLIDGEALPEPARSGSPATGFDKVLPIALFVSIVAGAILRRVLGQLPGAAVTGLLVSGLTWLLVGAIGLALLMGLIGFMLGLAPAGRAGRWASHPRGGFGGGSFGGGGFRGGGGGFGGGGASGRW
ncbi:MAG: YgcG family protein [Gammaproteobacteria bacterium]|nr:YgcG family protein [Gammaproteobacteria bacterium]MCP5140156.1 YgcG family protein [Chromatiales bacterium]